MAHILWHAATVCARLFFRSNLNSSFSNMFFYIDLDCRGAFSPGESSLVGWDALYCDNVFPIARPISCDARLYHLLYLG
jgi:hypothetical protein